MPQKCSCNIRSTRISLRLVLNAQHPLVLPRQRREICAWHLLMTSSRVYAKRPSNIKYVLAASWPLSGIFPHKNQFIEVTHIRFGNVYTFPDHTLCLSRSRCSFCSEEVWLQCVQNHPDASEQPERYPACCSPGRRPSVHRRCYRRPKLHLCQHWHLYVRVYFADTLIRRA